MRLPVAQKDTVATVPLKAYHIVFGNIMTSIETTTLDDAYKAKIITILLPQPLYVMILWLLWRLSGSNRRPLHCQRSALPAELSPLKFGTMRV